MPALIYDPEHHPILAAQYAREGLTNAEMCKRLGIGKSTFYLWQQRHPEFKEALREAKEVVDAQVEKALLNRALGYEAEEVDEVQEAEQTETGETFVPRRRTVRKKHIPGDVTAMRLWLLNRRHTRWKDKQEVNIAGSLHLQFDKEDAAL